MRYLITIGIACLSVLAAQEKLGKTGKKLTKIVIFWFFSCSLYFSLAFLVKKSPQKNNSKKKQGEVWDTTNYMDDSCTTQRSRSKMKNFTKMQGSDGEPCACSLVMVEGAGDMNVLQCYTKGCGSGPTEIVQSICDKTDTSCAKCELQATVDYDGAVEDLYENECEKMTVTTADENSDGS